MSAEWLIATALKSVVIAGAILILLLVMRKRSSAERAWLGHAGLAAILLLPAAALLMPAWEVPAPALGETINLPAARVELPSAMNPVRADDGTELRRSAPSLRPETLALLLYAFPACLILLGTFLALLNLQRLRHRAEVLVEQEWLGALARAQRRMGFKHGTALLISSDISSPISWGLLRPIILLDRAALGSPAQAEAIIAHELAHVARLDWAKLLIARLAVALFWFNPLVWMLAKQCHQLREEAADDAVLETEIPNTDYADMLLSAVRHQSKGSLVLANGIAPSRGSLKRRVARILDSRLARTPARIGWVFACAAGAALISAPLAAIIPSGAAGQSEAVKLEPIPSAPPRGDAQAALPRFHSLELRGSANVIVRRGAEQRIRLLRRDAVETRYGVDASGKLSIEGCSTPCNGAEPLIEVMTPDIEALAARDGGTIRVSDLFPSRQMLAVAVSGRGVIEAKTMPAAEVAAMVAGEGRIEASAARVLAAKISGQGSIRYWGDPEVHSMVTGGGTVGRAPDG